MNDIYKFCHHFGNHFFLLVCLSRVHATVNLIMWITNKKNKLRIFGARCIVVIVHSLQKPLFFYFSFLSVAVTCEFVCSQTMPYPHNKPLYQIAVLFAPATWYGRGTFAYLRLRRLHNNRNSTTVYMLRSLRHNPNSATYLMKLS